MKDNPMVGQKLYSLPAGNAARGVKRKLKPVTVSKVGRKYFYCDHFKDDPFPTRYYLDTWKQESGGFSPTSFLYASEAEYEEEKEAFAIAGTLCKSFEYGQNRLNVSFTDLRKIADILKPYMKEESE
jgi:hypothetical protein